MNAVQQLAAACVGMSPEECKAALQASKHGASIRDLDSVAAFLCKLSEMV